MRQSTLRQSEQQDDLESEYGHLMAHLIEQDLPKADNTQWTRVVSRDRNPNLLPSIMPLGPDLIFNKSIRESLSDIADFHGEVLFSPLLFKAEDLGVDLDQCQLSKEELALFARIATSAKERFTKDASRVEHAHGSPEDVDGLSLNRSYRRKKDIGKRLYKESGLAE